MNRTKKLILSATLLALSIVLSHFLSLKTPIVKISFGFLPTMLAALWLGPKWTFVISVARDLIGSLIFPSGPYFVGYTISASVAALIYGFSLYQKDYQAWNLKQLVVRSILAVVLVIVMVNLGLNTLWTSITTGKAFLAILGTRLVTQAVTAPIHVIVFVAIERATHPLFAKFLQVEHAESSESQV